MCELLSACRKAGYRDSAEYFLCVGTHAYAWTGRREAHAHSKYFYTWTSEGCTNIVEFMFIYMATASLRACSIYLYLVAALV